MLALLAVSQTDDADKNANAAEADDEQRRRDGERPIPVGKQRVEPLDLRVDERRKDDPRRVVEPDEERSGEADGAERLVAEGHMAAVVEEIGLE